MCGIVGYVGRAEAAPILLDGLRRLEYRGYDSAGVAIVNGKQMETRKCAGRIANLAKLMTEKPPSGQYGISHTRWATHGKVTDENAHPHFDQSGKIALVHNGVIENYAALREQLHDRRAFDPCDPHARWNRCGGISGRPRQLSPVGCAQYQREENGSRQTRQRRDFIARRMGGAIRPGWQAADRMCKADNRWPYNPADI
jgi:glutamate synthase domain-containing protein 1